MSKEAMKLALEAYLCREMPAGTIIGDPKWWAPKIAMAIDKALAEQPAQQDSTCSNALREQGKAYPRTCKKCGLGPCIELAQQALDKKAENARELGLDYEPVWGGGFTNKDYEDAMRQRRLHQLTSSPAQRTWVGLTDEEQQAAYDAWQQKDDGWGSFYALIEAKLKEKNT